MKNFQLAIMMILLVSTFYLATQRVSGQKHKIISKGTLSLAEAGMDTNLLGSAKDGTLEAFVEEEFELFGAMAATIDKLDGQPPRADPDDFQLIEALQTPAIYRGDYCRVKGTVRRISPITITSPALQEKTGRQVYYHIDLFVSTEGTSFRLKDDEGGVVIQGTYGITLILFDLPTAMKDAEKHTQFSIPGFYLKNWSHKTAETRGVSPELRRPNPIVFGLPSLIRMVDVSGARDGVGFFGWVLGSLLVILVLLAGWQLQTSLGRNRATADNPDSIDFSSLKNMD